jgi:flagellar protein FlbD
MIQLTRLNNHLLVVNSDLIKFVERAPDTVLTLITGEKVVVSEPVEVVLEKITEFRRSTQEAAKSPSIATLSATKPADERERDTD